MLLPFSAFFGCTSFMGTTGIYVIHAVLILHSPKRHSGVSGVGTVGTRTIKLLDRSWSLCPLCYLQHLGVVNHSNMYTKLTSSLVSTFHRRVYDAGPRLKRCVRFTHTHTNTTTEHRRIKPGKHPREPFDASE